MGQLPLHRDNDTKSNQSFLEAKGNCCRAQPSTEHRRNDLGLRHDPGPGPAARMIGLDSRNHLLTAQLVGISFKKY